ARITVNGRRAEISLKSKVSVKNWDAAKEKAKGKRDEIARLNTHMKTVRVQLSDCYNQLVQKRKIVTVQVVKSLYLGEDAEETATLLKLVEYHKHTATGKLAAGT